MEYYKQKFIDKIKLIPISLPVVISLVCCYGFLLLYSASGGDLHPWAYKQIMVFLVFLPVSIFLALINIKFIYKVSYIFYIFTFILLIAIEFVGKSAMGATRWLDLGIISLQPSELVKISIIMMLAKYFHDSKEEKTNIIIPIILSLMPIALVIKQPDLGTGMITLMVVVTIFFAIGLNIWYFIISFIGILIFIPIIWSFMYDYQKKRILTFLYPENDPLGAGYNIIQSKIAIGSGGLFGKGFMNGTQGHLKFLPEYQTDFIFAFLAEEFGFVGGVILLLLYLVLIIQSLLISVQCKSYFAKVMVIGVITLFFCHVFINISMVMGLVPVVGVPLPLVSYGRTMMVSILLGFGLIMNAAVNRKVKI